MALAIVFLQLLIREVKSDQGTTKGHTLLPLAKKKKKEFLQGYCHHPQGDNNDSEAKCKLRWGEILSACLHIKK